MRSKTRGPCTRVIYASDYHVDLVVYGKPASQGSNVLMLGHRDLGWRDANPVGLEVFVDSARIPYEGTADSRTSTDQFRRVVRYLKRWYDEAIPHDSERKPSGLAYTLLVAAQGAPPHLNFEGLPDDLEALAALAAYGADAQGRLNVQKPTPEYEDLLEGLSDAAMNALKRRFSSLRDALAEAKEIVDPVEACTLLHRNEYLGRDFPIPKRSDTAKKSAAPAFVPASTSA